MDSLIQKNLKKIITVSKQHRVKSISLFGSAVSDTMHDESDVDFLVEFSNRIDVLDYADNYFSLLEKLERILNRKVDLVSIKSLKNTILKNQIYQTKVNLYAA